ncbi:MAG: cell division protein ZipA C-terminal FtsZ-binding domain-containing protein [Pseudomonadota bacterium]
MAELRWLILFLGAVFIVAVYLAMRGQDRRGARGRRAERQEPVLGAGGATDPWDDLRREPALDPLDDVEEGVGEVVVVGRNPDSEPATTREPLDTPPYLRQRDEPTFTTADELPIVNEGARAAPLEGGDRPASASRRRPPAEQLEIDVPAPSDRDAPEEDVDADDADPASGFEEVFTLRLVPRSGGVFEGSTVGEGLQTAGLSRGQFDIYHYTPPGSGQSVFSVANLVEPGTLRDEDLQGQSLPGLTVFMLLPGPLTGVKALEEMITASRLLANYLDADVQDDTGGSLTRQTEEHLKERVVTFEHRRARQER